MPQSFTIPEQTYPVGTYTQTIDQITGAKKELELRFTRVNWPGTENDIVLSVSVEATWDNGVTWHQMVGATFPGGVIQARTGGILTESILGWAWPGINDGNGNRAPQKPDQCRITAEVFQELTTAVTYETLNR